MTDESIPAGNRALAPGLPDIDHELLGRMLRHLESNVHRHGWDVRLSSMHVYVLYDNRISGTDQVFRRAMAGNPRLGPGYRLGPLTAQMMISPEVLFSAGGARRPWETLRQMAERFAYLDAPEADAMRGVLKHPGVWALAACNESWKRTLQGADQLRAEQHLSWADLPGSLDARSLVCVDARDTVHFVERVRGSKPVLTMDAPHFRGDASTSLRIMLDMIYSRLPDIDEFDDRYPTILEYHERRVRAAGDGPGDAAGK